ncbi:MAG: hypothetical protein WKG07_37815 [Hymenobacter sp.]
MGLTFDRTGQGTLRVWAPTAEALRLRLYVAGAGGAAPATHAMQRGPGRHLAAGATGRHRRLLHWCRPPSAAGKWPKYPTPTPAPWA